LSTNRTIVVAGGWAGTVDTNGNNITYGGTLVNNGTFTKAGAGTFEIDPLSLSSFSALIVAGGKLRLNVSTASIIGNNTTATVNSGATLELAGSISALGALNGTQNGVTSVVNNSQAAEGGLHITGSNQQVGAITGTGNTVIDASRSLVAYQ